MKPIDFEGSNRLFVADGCGDLPAYTDGTFVSTVWQLDDDDIAALKRNGGKLTMFVYSGSVTPPVALKVYEGEVEASEFETFVEAEKRRLDGHRKK